MTKELITLADKVTFEKIAYVGFRRYLIYIFLFVTGVSLLTFSLSDLIYFIEYFESEGMQFEFKRLFSIIGFFVSIAILVFVGNLSTKDSMNVKFWKFRERNKQYRHLAVSILMLEFKADEGEFHKLKIKKAIKLLSQEREIIKSKYRKVYLAYIGVFGVVWYHFVATMFDLNSHNLETTLLVFISLSLAGIFGILIRQVAKIFIKEVTKLSKIDNLVDLLNETNRTLREK